MISDDYVNDNTEVSGMKFGCQAVSWPNISLGLVGNVRCSASPAAYVFEKPRKGRRHPDHRTIGRLLPLDHEPSKSKPAVQSRYLLLRNIHYTFLFRFH